MRIDQAILAEAKKKIAEGETEEVIEDLLDFLKPVMQSSRYNELVMQSARLNKAQKDFNLGILTSESYRTERQRINRALLYLLDKYYKRDFSNSAPYALRIPEEEGGEVSREKIIGSSNLAPIAWLQKGLQASKAVCKVLLPDGASGTGFLIGGGRVLTNFHVLNGADVAAEARLAFDYEADADGQIKKQYFYRLKPDSFQGDQKLDFAVLEIEEGEAEVPLSNWGFLQPNLQYQPREDRYLTIVQHPSGRPKELAFDRVVGAQGSFLNYRTDTEPGSSGSPVFDENWQVVALHHGSLKGRAVNQGTLLSALTSYLEF